MYWIYDYPSWIIGPLFVAVFVAVTWIGIFLTRRTVHSWLHRDKRANEMVGDALSNFFILFGILARSSRCCDLPKLRHRRRYCR